MSPTVDSRVSASGSMSLFGATALPGKEKEFDTTLEKLVQHLLSRPTLPPTSGESWNPKAWERYRISLCTWDSERSALHRLLYDLSDKSTIINIDTIGRWAMNEYEKGGDWLSRCRIGSTREATPEPTPPLAPIQTQVSVEEVVTPDEPTTSGELSPEEIQVRKEKQRLGFLKWLESKKHKPDTKKKSKK